MSLPSNVRVPVKLILLLFAIVALSGRPAESQWYSSATTADCGFIKPSVISALDNIDDIPQVREINGDCFFITNRGHSEHTLSFKEHAPINVATLTKENVSQYVGERFDSCDAPFSISGNPALWCMVKNQGAYLFVRLSGSFKELFVERGFCDHIGLRDGVRAYVSSSPEDEKQFAVSLAKVAYLHEPIPASVFATDALVQGSSLLDSPHGLKSGVWKLVQVTNGDRYLALSSGTAAYGTCITDQGAELQKLVPHDLGSCKRVNSPGVNQVSISCRSGGGGDKEMSDLSARFDFTLVFEDAEHYSMHGEMTQLQTFNQRNGAGKRVQSIGEASIELKALWVAGKCGLNPPQPVAITPGGLILGAVIR